MKKINRLLKRIRYEYRIFLKRIYLWRKKHHAINMHKITGKRYHVIPTDKGKLAVVDNSFIDKYNRIIRNKAQRMTIEKLLKISFFSTPVEGITRNINKN